MLYIVYGSPENSPIYNDRDEKNGIVSILAELKLNFPDCLFYLAGDFNSRTKDLLDFIPDDSLSHLYYFPVDCLCDEFESTPNNKNTDRFNNFGRSLVELYC